MKRSTVQNKLLDLLGGVNPELKKFKAEVPKKGNKSSKNPKYSGVSEEVIQEFRAMQGLIYFLQAPELFTQKICPHCGEAFLVSRQFVAFCSYTCIAKDFEQRMGIKWSKGNDLEALVKDPHVYEGNEPIWIRNLDRIKAVLDTAASPSLLASTSLTEK